MRADEEVLLDGQALEDPAALGRERDAQRHTLVRRRVRVMSGAVEGDLARRRGDLSGDRLQQGGLPGAVGADHGEGLALLDGEVDAVDRLEVAVVDVEAGDRQQAHDAASPMSKVEPR